MEQKLKETVRKWLDESHSLATSMIEDSHLDDLVARLKALGPASPPAAPQG